MRHLLKLIEIREERERPLETNGFKNKFILEILSSCTTHPHILRLQGLISIAFRMKQSNNTGKMRRKRRRRR